MIRVTWTRQGAVPDAARPPSFGLDVLLADLSKPERIRCALILRHMGKAQMMLLVRRRIGEGRSAVTLVGC